MISILAATLLSQCATGITDNAQNLCGLKTFDDGLVSKGQVNLSGPYGYIQGDSVIYARDNVPTGSSSPSFYFQTFNSRYPWDEVLRVTNGSNPVLVLYGDGRVHVTTITTTGHSGDPSLSATKNYVGISADYPPKYQGEHGAVSISTTSPCENEAFNLLQASDGLSGVGARSDYTINFTCLGGRYSRRPPSSTALPLCNGALGEPPEPNNRYGNCTNLTDAGFLGSFGWAGPLTDGGYCYNWTTYYGPDGGFAKDGEVFDYVVDVGQGCQCVVAKWDGGASPAGWFKLSDRTECRP